MGKSLYIAEKPSVAQEFAKALGLNLRRRDGYLESEDSIVTWCVGHLVTMSYPEEYDAGLKRWNLETLPFIPQEFNCPRIFIIGCLGRLHSCLAHTLPQGWADGVAGGFLQHLLVVPLDGTVTLPQPDGMAILIRQDLDFNMAGLFYIFLNIHRIIAKGIDGLLLR